MGTALCGNTDAEISKRPTILMPTAEEDKAITAAARRDPDAQPLTPKQLKSMVPIQRFTGHLEILKTSKTERQHGKKT
jgi:hypothetical protein